MTRRHAISRSPSSRGLSSGASQLPEGEAAAPSGLSLADPRRGQRAARAPARTAPAGGRAATLPAGATSWTDERTLLLLHLRDVESRSFREVAAALGVSRNACLGLYHRVWTQTRRDWPQSEADGTLAPGWWMDRTGAPT